VKAGDNKVDAVVVDEESVGSVNSPGCGAKILRGHGALDKYLANVEHRVRFVFALWLQSFILCFFIWKLAHTKIYRFSTSYQSFCKVLQTLRIVCALL